MTLVMNPAQVGLRSTGVLCMLVPEVIPLQKLTKQQNSGNQVASIWPWSARCAWDSQTHTMLYSEAWKDGM